MYHKIVLFIVLFITLISLGCDTKQEFRSEPEPLTAEEWKGKYNDANTTISMYHDQIQECYNLVDSLRVACQDSISTLNGKIARLTSQLSQARTGISRLARNAGEIQDNNIVLQQQLDSCERNNMRLSARNLLLTNDANYWKGECYQLQTECSHLESRLNCERNRGWWKKLWGAGKCSD